MVYTWHSCGKSQCLMGKSTVNGDFPIFSIATLNYWRVGLTLVGKWQGFPFAAGPANVLMIYPPTVSVVVTTLMPISRCVWFESSAPPLHRNFVPNDSQWPKILRHSSSLTVSHPVGEYLQCSKSLSHSIESWLSFFLFRASPIGLWNNPQDIG